MTETNTIKPEGREADPEASHNDVNSPSLQPMDGESGSSNDARESPLDQLNDTNANLFVAGAMAILQIEVRYDGSLIQHGVKLRADTQAMIEEVLVADELAGADVLDKLLLIKANHGYKGIKSEPLKAAFRTYCREQQNLRRKEIMKRLLRQPSDEERGRAELEWQKVNSLFDMDTSLPASVIGHFMWQVKQKVLGRPLVHHLMPIIYSSLQGSGKTTFVRKLLDPLHELASADTLVSDFADKRSGSIYRYIVVLIDDMELLPKSAVPGLKSLITSNRINRRKVHTDQNVSIRQRATLIGTANAPVQELINDPTGHRRFATLTFQNGDEAKGGDPAVWKTVSSLDYDLLWRSVDAFGPSPIADHVRELHEFQNIGRPTPPLLSWLRTLDVASSAVKAVTTRFGVRADGLRELYMMQMSTIVSNQRFKEEMTTYLGDPLVPFAEWRAVEIGKVYTLKSGRRSPRSLDTVAQEPNPTLPLSGQIAPQVPPASPAPPDPSA